MPSIQRTSVAPSHQRIDTLALRINTSSAIILHPPDPSHSGISDRHAPQATPSTPSRTSNLCCDCDRRQLLQWLHFHFRYASAVRPPTLFFDRAVGILCATPNGSCNLARSQWDGVICCCARERCGSVRRGWNRGMWTYLLTVSESPTTHKCRLGRVIATGEVSLKVTLLVNDVVLCCK